MDNDLFKEMADLEDKAGCPLAISPGMLANSTKDNASAAGPMGSAMGGPVTMTGILSPVVSSSHAHTILGGIDWGTTKLPRHQLAAELFLLLLEFDLSSDQEKFLEKISDLVDGDNLKAMAIYQRLKCLAKGFIS